MAAPQQSKKRPPPTTAPTPPKDDDSKVPRESLKDLVLKAEWVVVGDLQLRLREPGMLTAAEAAAQLFTDDFTEAVKNAGIIVALEVQAQAEYGPAAMRHTLGANAVAVAKIVFEGIALCGRSTYAVAALLDSDENRKKFFAAFKLEDDSVAQDDDPGSVYSPSFRGWAARAITPTQFEYFLQKLGSMRGWTDLVKKLAGRLGLDPKAIEAIRAAARKPALPAGAQPTSTSPST